MKCRFCGEPQNGSAMPYAPEQSRQFPMSKPLIWVLNLFLTPLVGAICYYMWKSKHPEAAKYANRVSLACFLFWFLLCAIPSILAGLQR